MNLLKKTASFLFPTLLLAVPNSPTNVTFTDVSEHSITINWQDNSNDESGFKIYRDYVLIAIASRNSTSFTDFRLDPNKGYTYTIKSTDDNMDGDVSEKVIGEKLFRQGASIGAFVYTPQRGGAIVLEVSGYNQDIYLYGMQNPNYPLQEYKIYGVGRAQYIYDLHMLGSGKISFKVSDEETGSKYEITYDYFNKKEISRTDISNNELSFKDKLKRSMGLGEMSSIRSITYTPQRGGLIASVVTDQGSYLALFGLEDPDNPVFEYDIEIDDMGHKSYTDIVMKGGGIVEYTTYNYSKRAFVRVSYNYFVKRVVSIREMGVTTEVKYKIDNYLDEKYIHKNSGYNVKSLEHIEDDLYLLTVDFWGPADDYRKTSVIKVSGSVTEQKSLAYIKYGPGGYEAKNIQIDRDNNIIRYETNMSWMWVENAKSYDDYHMDGIVSFTYNYENSQYEKILPLR